MINPMNTRSSSLRLYPATRNYLGYDRVIGDNERPETQNEKFNQILSFVNVLACLDPEDIKNLSVTHKNSCLSALLSLSSLGRLAQLSLKKAAKLDSMEQKCCLRPLAGVVLAMALITWGWSLRRVDLLRQPVMLVSGVIFFIVSCLCLLNGSLIVDDHDGTDDRQDDGVRERWIYDVLSIISQPEFGERYSGIITPEMEYVMLSQSSEKVLPRDLAVKIAQITDLIKSLTLHSEELHQQLSKEMFFDSLRDFIVSSHTSRSEDDFRFWASSYRPDDIADIYQLIRNIQQVSDNKHILNPSCSMRHAG